MPRRQYTYEERLFELFQVTAPRYDEHRLTFSIRFSCSESRRLKAQGPLLNSEALRTIRDLLQASAWHRSRGRPQQEALCCLHSKGLRITCSRLGSMQEDIHIRRIAWKSNLQEATQTCTSLGLLIQELQPIVELWLPRWVCIWRRLHTTSVWTI